MTIETAVVGLALIGAAVAVLALLAVRLSRRQLADVSAILAQTRHTQRQAVEHHRRTIHILEARIAEIGDVLNLYRHELAVTPRADDIVRLLASAGPLTGPEIASQLGLAPHVLNERLAVAERLHGLVASELSGGEFYYRHVSRFARDVTETTELHRGDLAHIMAAA